MRQRMKEDAQRRGIEGVIRRHYEDAVRGGMAQEHDAQTRAWYYGYKACCQKIGAEFGVDVTPESKLVDSKL